MKMIVFVYVAYMQKRALTHQVLDTNCKMLSIAPILGCSIKKAVANASNIFIEQSLKKDVKNSR